MSSLQASDEKQYDHDNPDCRDDYDKDDDDFADHDEHYCHHCRPVEQKPQKCTFAKSSPEASISPD